MTAEIAVLNKDAVALAADSTVTITGSKTFHSTNKLFALSSKHAVGVMIYGSSELGGIPWETLIKLYRKKIGSKLYPSLSEYRDDFISFLETGVGEYSLDEQKQIFEHYVDDYLDVLVDEIDSSVKERIQGGENLSDAQIATVVRKVIDRHHDIWLHQEALSFATKNLVGKFKKEYRSLVDEEILRRLEKHRVSRERKDKILDTCVRIFSSKFEEVTGLVVAGFGEDEIFPKTINCQVEGIFFGKLKYQSTTLEIENSEKKSAAIAPFAVKDVAALFMEGISSEMLNCVQAGAVRILGDQIEHVQATLEAQGVKQSKVDKIVDELTDEAPELLDTLQRYISSTRYSSHVKPVLDAVEFLPKSEMAEVAESLVSITSFRQKISLDKESVGGDIDVAVISKSDGFIWIKRKNYFNSELNPHKAFEASCY